MLTQDIVLRPQGPRRVGPEWNALSQAGPSQKRRGTWGGTRCRKLLTCCGSIVKAHMDHTDETRTDC